MTAIVTVTVGDAAREIDVRVDEIYRLVRSGRLKATKVRGKLAIDYDSLMKHIAKRDKDG